MQSLIKNNFHLTILENKSFIPLVNVINYLYKMIFNEYLIIDP